MELNEKIFRFAEDSGRSVYEVEKLLDVKPDGSGGYLIQVKWMGFDEIESSWEPIDNLWEDIPLKVSEFLQKKSLNEFLEILRNK